MAHLWLVTIEMEAALYDKEEIEYTRSLAALTADR